MFRDAVRAFLLNRATALGLGKGVEEMKLKKALAVAVAGATLLIGSTTAFAHCGGGGHHGRRARNTVTYSTCNYENCNIAETHVHDGCYYYGHYYGDGHTHHPEDCGNSYCHY